jgi:hypothetical protein
MPIEPETKSWTWVNERPCTECGFDASSTEPRQVPELLVANVADWKRLLSAPNRVVTTRPDDTTWSALEYACHARDVLELLASRFDRLLSEEHPHFEDWHPDRIAAARDYAAESDPEPVVDRIGQHADRVIAHITAMTDEQWQRSGTRADGLVFTAAWLSTYLTHDVIHHVHDVEAALAQQRD